MDMNKIDVIQQVPKRACKCFSPTCSYCKHEEPHPSPVYSNWSSKDWDGNKAKAKEQKSLIDFEPPKPDSDKKLTDQLTDMRKVILVDGMTFQNLTIGQDKKGGTTRDNKYTGSTSSGNDNGFGDGYSKTR